MSVLMAAVFVNNAAALSYSKSWYMDRARENVKIENYKAAIEAYQKASELDPDDTVIMKELARAYEIQGLTDKAIELNDHYLALNKDDANVLFKQAEVLSGERYGYRRRDAIRYYQRGLALKDDKARRLRHHQ